MFGAVVRTRKMASVSFHIFLQPLLDEPVVFRKFQLRDQDGNLVDGMLVLSITVCENKEPNLWTMFEHESDLPEHALPELDEKNILIAGKKVALILFHFVRPIRIAISLRSSLRVLCILFSRLALSLIHSFQLLGFAHLKPTYVALHVLFYTILRPIYWAIVEVRTLLTDWEDPTRTLLCFALALYMWWIELVAFLIIGVILFKVARVVGSKKNMSADQLDHKTMVLEYRLARDAVGS